MTHSYFKSIAQGLNKKRKNVDAGTEKKYCPYIINVTAAGLKFLFFSVYNSVLLFLQRTRKKHISDPT